MKKRASYVALLVAMAACTTTPQDAGDGSSAPISGRAIDGYLANAIVYVDTNQNGILDPWEPRAFTDTDGYFGYNSKVDGENYGENYCALPKSDSKYKHCLKLPPYADEALIQITKGYDTVTGEPFKGTLTSWATRTDAMELPGSNSASPITSLLAYMTPAYRLEYAAVEGLTGAEMAGDILVNLGEIGEPLIEQSRRYRINLAMQIQKTAEIINPYLNSLYKDSDGQKDLFGNNKNYPQDPNPYWMKSLAKTLMGNAVPSSVSSIHSDPAKLWTQIIAARDLINADTVPDGIAADTTLTSGSRQNIADRLSEFALFVDTLMSAATNSTDKDTAGLLSDERDIGARMRAIEVVTSLLRDPSKANLPNMDPAAQRAIDLALGTGSATPSDAVDYLFGLSSPKADIFRLVEDFQTNGMAVAASASDFVNRQTMDQQVGGVLGTDEVNLNLTSNKDSTNTADLVFNPDGTLTAAIGYTDPNNSGNNLSADTPLPGTWEKINDYTILANVNVGGEVRPMIVRTDSNGTGYVFDFGGDIAEWTPH
ncbi:MAG: hypothetical protein OEW58_00245 [Gammaproteobacteria bacterium]|nr:hypothetical protein [Gammaproteobacteria bacterium]